VKRVSFHLSAGQIRSSGVVRVGANDVKGAQSRMSLFQHVDEKGTVNVVQETQ
jgi:hypothetical protein